MSRHRSTQCRQRGKHGARGMPSRIPKISLSFSLRQIQTSKATDLEDGAIQTSLHSVEASKDEALPSNEAGSQANPIQPCFGKDPRHTKQYQEHQASILKDLPNAISLPNYQEAKREITASRIIVCLREQRWESGRRSGRNVPWLFKAVTFPSRPNSCSYTFV